MVIVHVIDSSRRPKSYPRAHLNVAGLPFKSIDRERAQSRSRTIYSIAFLAIIVILAWQAGLSIIEWCPWLDFVPLWRCSRILLFINIFCDSKKCTGSNKNSKQ